ncbi:Bug family tripartite tricarboxylate transporter substrate binding protein [Pseudorhodoferax soli]|uniref:Tripartite-type tricarboxylate transporter receptor subunit TctC n=1 Tax=Pseudorhodoferax soli TaxID=545864 RepID=A0A368XRF5_9BURK|nr:tripartite tricarboxylate transporter substrate binding protein [Pseudorhodoferax soli]RCW70553.1 tripartite-type tricarboxylate transporter receptor subunit TctC [Pseudorhodoferax soli]
MHKFLKSAAAIALGMAAFSAFAQAWPSKPIRVVVPFPAGGPVDQTARALGAKVGTALGQNMLIDNKGGAGGLLGADAVAKAAPDGYTVLFSSAGALAIVPHIAASMPYDPQKDLMAVTQALKVPAVLVVSSASPYKNFAELKAAATGPSSKINYASAGSGTTPHLQAELLRREAGLTINHIPYRGAAPAITDILGGQVDMMVVDIPVALPFIQSGKLRALAVTNNKRIPVLKDVPTVAELGLPKVEAYNWYGMLAPARTPADIVAKLYSSVGAALRSPDLQKQFDQQGVEVVGSKPEEFAPFIAAESARWGALAKAVGAKLE